MKLYLARHGQAKPKSEDPDRHLTDEGQRITCKVAELLKPQNLKVNAIWHSGKPRAEQTAEILWQAVTSETGITPHDHLGAGAPIGQILDELRQINEDTFIVGHLPFLNKLASALTAGDENADVFDFAASGILCLHRDDEGAWRTKWYLSPELLPC